MGYSFTDGLVATAAQLNQAVGPVLLTGIIKITPVANTLTSKRVTFPPGLFASAPHVQVTTASTVAGSTLRGWSATNVDTSGVDIWIYRTNTTNTYLQWCACLLPAFFTDGQSVAASMLNQGAGGMVCQTGVVTITPTSANTPRSATITFPAPFAATPTVQATALSGTPTDILGTGATSPTTSGVKIWLTRANTTATQVQWIAIGRM